MTSYRSLYKISELREVSNFIFDHPELKECLKEAYIELRKIFPDNDFILESPFEPERCCGKCGMLRLTIEPILDNITYREHMNLVDKFYEVWYDNPAYEKAERLLIK